MFRPKIQAALDRIDAKAIAVFGSDAPITGPYDACFLCKNRKTQCDGPGVVTMPLPRWCVWIAKLAAIEELTYNDIAERSGVSIATVSRIFSFDPPDNIRWHTVAEISRAVLDVPGGRFPCAKHLYEDVEAQMTALRDENDALRSQIAALTSGADSHSSALEQVQEDAQRRIAFLSKEIERKNQLILQQSEQISKLMSKILG